MNKDYSILKKYYGEDFAKLCRELFPTLLEKEGLLSSIILSKFAPNKFLYNDITKYTASEKTITNLIKNNFKNYIYGFTEDKKEIIQTNKTVKELLSDAGYIFYECKTDEDIQSFKKYYTKDEEICTFAGGRLNSCYVFWAIKKDVEKIKREKFTKPKRQDLYGTSVISIQITREGNTLSIKNRYNHHVENPDATFSNNLDNIIPGLTYAFEKEFGIKINQSESNVLYLPNYVLSDDGKYYKYNYEINNIYYCPNNIIIDNCKVIELDTSRYLLIDYFIIDFKEKIIKLYDNTIEDSFIDSFTEIKNIGIIKNKDRKEIIIKQKNNETSKIVINKLGQIIEIDNEHLKRIGNKYLHWNSTLNKINLPKLLIIGDWFMPNNKDLTKIYLPNLSEIGCFFLLSNKKLTKAYLPKLKSIGEYFLKNNEKIANSINNKENNYEKTKNRKQKK
ncbi:MAG: hypothetical protein IKF19_00150 [Bacilli bacterium]|nr:hypothetical protein [Bacilli bacterium]